MFWIRVVLVNLDEQHAGKLPVGWPEYLTSIITSLEIQIMNVRSRRRGQWHGCGVSAVPSTGSLYVLGQEAHGLGKQQDANRVWCALAERWAMCCVIWAVCLGVTIARRPLPSLADNSYILKLACFYAVNSYASLIYVAVRASVTCHPVHRLLLCAQATPLPCLLPPSSCCDSVHQGL